MEPRSNVWRAKPETVKQIKNSAERTAFRFGNRSGGLVKEPIYLHFVIVAVGRGHNRNNHEVPRCAKGFHERARV